MSDNRLPELVNQIKEKLSEAFQALKRNLEFYREAGRLLCMAKTELKAYSRQPWKAWLKSPEGPGIHHRVAEFYMRLHRRWKDIAKDPDFNPAMGYMAALRLVRKPKNKRQAQKTTALAPLLSGPASNDNWPQTVPMSLPEPATVNGTPGISIPERTTMPLTEADGVLGSPCLPKPSPQVRAMLSAPQEPVFNATAKVIGEADLVVTPGDGYGLKQVLSMVAAGEAVVQEQNNTITRHNAEIIATFTETLRTWKLADMTVIAQAA
jgi:hypothetical protein